MNISVQRNGAEVEDGCCGAHDVEGDPSVAELRTEHPVAKEIVYDSESHHQRCDEQIRDCQGRKEQIADLTQTPLCIDGDTDQDVSSDG